MLSGVLEVIESVSSAIMSIRFQLSSYSEQEAQKLANIATPHPVLREQNDFGILTEIVNNFPAF